MPLSPEEIALMQCPRCAGSLESGPGSLRCLRCKAIHEVRDGIPDLLPWTGGPPGPEWARWRERLDRLQEWRRATWDGSPASDDRQKVADDLATEFFKFARVPETGALLEIGCGSAELRRFVPRRRYWGLDPLIGTPGAPEPGRRNPGDVFVRGVGERLPLADGGFDTVLVCETLDHSLDPSQVIREARRVLKDGGVLAVMQSVRLTMPSPSLSVRLRSAAGRMKSKLMGTRRVEDADTKMHAIGQDDLAALVGAELLVESGVTRGQTMFLRALKQNLAAPRAPKRNV